MFLWFHARHPGRIRKIDKKLVNHITNPGEIAEEDKDFISNLDYDGIEFPVQEKDFNKIKVKKNISINVFSYENELIFPVYVSDQKFKDWKDWICCL